MSEISSLPPVRRVITGHNKDGKSVILDDGVQPTIPIPGGNDVFINIHCTENIPASIDAELVNGSYVEESAPANGFCPPAGVRFGVFTLAPGSVTKHHRTQTLDYGIVMSGSVVLELDDGQTTVLNKGDICCMRGTAHTYRNESATEWVQFYGILTGAKPVIVNGEELKLDWDISSKTA